MARAESQAAGARGTSPPSTLRRAVVVLLTAGNIAGLLLAVVFGHMDLWLVRLEGEDLAWNWRVAGPLLAAAGCMLALALLHLRAIGGFARSRRALVAVNVVLLVVAALALAVLVNLISHGRYHRFDVTAAGTYSIGERTRSILDRIDRDIRAYVFVSPGNPWFGTIRGMLESYAAESGGRLRVELLNPGRDLLRFERVLSELGIDPRELPEPGVIIFAARPDDDGAPPRTRHVTLPALLAVDRSAEGRDRPPRFRGEEAFTRAILAVTRERQPVVRLTRGHLELDPGGSPARSIRELDRTLRSLDYRVEPLTLTDAEAPEVPEDTDVLAIIGPETPFAEAEVDAIAAWVETGGRLLLLTEPVARSRPGRTARDVVLTGLERILFGFGVTPLPARLRCEQTMSPTLGAWSLAAPFNEVSERHPITRPLTGRWLGLHGAQPLVLQPPVDPDASLRLVPLARTLPSAIAIDLTAPDQDHGEAEAYTVAAAARRVLGEDREARLVVAGDGAIASDELTTGSPELANLSFLVNAVGWLAEREETIALEARPPQVIHLRLDRDRRVRLQLLSLLELPLALAALGLLVWLVRRR